MILVPDIDSFPGVQCVGAEITANGKFGYITKNANTSSKILRLDISVFDSVSINNSLEIISDSSNTGGYGSMQIGIDRNIYFTSTAYDWLGEIQNPDSEFGYSVNDTAINLSPGYTHAGLPDFIQTYFHNAYFDYSIGCDNEPVQFFIRNNLIDSVHWDFGDPASGTLNFSTVENPIHQFTSIDTFGVTSVVFSAGVSDTFYREIILIESPSLASFQNEYRICEGEAVKVFLPTNDFITNVLWEDSTTQLKRTFNQHQDSLNFTLYNFCDTVKGFIKISVDSNFSVSLSADTILCDQQSFTIDATADKQADFLWADGSQGSSITVTETGIYSVLAFNTCDTIEDSTSIVFNPSPQTILLSDTAFCADPFQELMFLKKEDEFYSYVNPSGDTVNRLFTDANGLYTILAENDCGTIAKSVSLASIKPTELSILKEGVFCEGLKVELTATTAARSLLWSTGDTSRSIVAYESGSYTVFVKDEFCEVQESINLVYDDCESACSPRINNVFSPNGDGINDVFKVEIDCHVSSYRLSLFNRWGQEVFFITNTSMSWDGFLNGVAAANGVYFYVIEYNDPFGNPLLYKGTFFLLI